MYRNEFTHSAQQPHVGDDAITAAAWSETKHYAAFLSMTAFASFHSGKALRKHISARERVEEGFKTSVGSQINTVMKDLRVMGS